MRRVRLVRRGWGASAAASHARRRLHLSREARGVSRLVHRGAVRGTLQHRTRDVTAALNAPPRLPPPRARAAQKFQKRFSSLAIGLPPSARAAPLRALGGDCPGPRSQTLR